MHDPSATPTLDATLAATALGTQPGRERDRVVAVGQAIGRYVVLERLGAGGMGVVFAAYDPQLDRKVAVKLLKRNSSSDGAETGGDRDRLLEEARALAQLSHPNVIAVHDVGVHDGEVFVAMEFIDGVTLTDWQREEGRTTDDVLRTYLAAGAGLSAAHRAGLVHRDFKPDNVMVDREGRARVLDFGLARPTRNKVDLEAIGDARPDAPETLATVGTPAYMAPEQFAGERVDARSDQFAFCVALYEALYGERPFRGDTVAELATSTLEQRPAFAVPILDVPPRVADALHRGLEKKAEKRFADMDALLRQLDDTPSKTPRWLLGLGLAGLVGGAAAVAAFVPEQPEHDACPRAAAVDEQWGPKQLATIERALTTEEGLETAAFEMSRRLLDRHAVALKTHELGLCADIEAKRVNAAQEIARRRCLDRRTRHLASLVELADTAPDTFRARPGELLGTLQTVASCVRADLETPEVDGANVEEFDRLMTELDQAFIRLVGGDLDEPQQEIEAVLAEAKEKGHRWVEARAHIMLGQASDQAGDPTGAKEHFKLAFSTGLASDHRAAMSDAAVLLAKNGAWHGDLDGAQYWLSLAEAIAERMPPAEDRIGELVSARGSVAEARGDLLAARDAFQEAVDSCQELFGRHSTRCLMDWSRLADAQAATGETEQALANYEELMELQIGRFGRNHPRSALFLQGHAMVLRHASKFDAALARMQEAIDASVEIWGEDGPRLASMYGNHAGMLGDLGRFEEATAALDRALAIQRGVDGSDSLTMSYGYSMRGQFRALLGDYAGADADLVRTTTIRDEFFDIANEAVVTGHRIHAEVRLVGGMLDAALESAAKVIEACDARQSCVDPAFSARTVRVAVLTSLGRDAEAKAALEGIHALEKKGRLSIAYTHVAKWIVDRSAHDKATLSAELERVAGRGNLLLAWIAAQP